MTARTAADPVVFEQALTAGAATVGLHGVAAHWPGALRTGRWQASVPPEAVVGALLDLVERYRTLLAGERATSKQLRVAVDQLTGGARAVLDLAGTPAATLFETAV